MNPEERFTFDRELANTLQGRIYLGRDITTGDYVVLKEAWKHLVKSGKSRTGHAVPEDFIGETQLMYKISDDKGCPEGIIKSLAKWEDDQCYYIAMEYCNIGLFDYISQSHNKKLKKYVINESNKKQEALSNNNPTPWILKCQFLFTQLVYGVKYLHSKNICHLDLSLENSMLKLYKIDLDKYEFDVKDDYNIAKVIDFGLAIDFTDLKKEEFSHNQRVGKIGYMAPEVFAKQKYDARSADIYCLGVMLFMMLCGAPPYSRPELKDPAFKYIIKGRIEDVLKHWKRLRLVTKDALDLMKKCLTFEKDRINMAKLIQHPFVQFGVQLGQKTVPQHFPKKDKKPRRQRRKKKGNDDEKKDDE